MIAIVVQARMGSTRLPGKVLMPIGGRPMLSYQMERLRRVRRADAIVLATPDKPADDPIVAFAQAEGFACVRGSEQDVLSRYAKAAKSVSADVVVRITSDCPLIDPDLVDEAIAAYVEASPPVDYVSNMITPTWPYGMAVEVFSAGVLHEADANAKDPAEREHVTPYIYWRPERFRIKSLTRSPDFSHHRWTVDTPEDFDLVSRIFDALYPANPSFTTNDVLGLLKKNPAWTNINAHVAQKKVAATDGDK